MSATCCEVMFCSSSYGRTGFGKAQTGIVKGVLSLG